MTKRERILAKTNGRCAYCGCQLSKGWHADHMESINRVSTYDREKRKFVHTGEVMSPENDHEDNLIAACASCNITKSGMTVERFRGYIERTIDIMNQKHYAAYKFAKRFGLIEEKPKPVVFYFETLTAHTGEKE